MRRLKLPDVPDSHLVQPDGVLTVVDPAAMGEEELGEWDLRAKPAHEEQDVRHFKRFNGRLARCRFPNLDVLPVGPPSGVQEVGVYVVFLVREVRLCGNVYHPGAAIASHAKVKRVETGPVKVLLPVK